MKQNNILKKILNTIYMIFIKFCIYIYRVIKYIWFAIIWPIILIVVLIEKLVLKAKTVNVEKLREKSQKIKEKDKIKEEKQNKNKIKTKKQDLSSYKDKTVKVERKNLGYFINAIIGGIVAIPTNIKNRIQNTALIKQAKNKRDFDTKSLLVDFSDEDKQNDGKKVTWEYVAINKKGKKIKGYFQAFSRVDVQSFLLGEGLVVYSIRTSKLVNLLYGDLGANKIKIKIKDLIFLTTQLSTYIKSGIPLVDSLNILIKQTQNKKYKKILREVTYDLSTGESLSSAMEKRGAAFPKLLINMVKAAELTGDLPEVLDDMVEYYTEQEEVRKEMISALTYPSMVFFFTIAVLTFVLVFVVPKFVDIYNTMDSSAIPAFTLIVIDISNYLQNNFMFIILIVIIGLLLIYYLYKYVKIIRMLMQWCFMHIPVLKDIIIYNEVTTFAKTFSSLLMHNVYITDSMDILNRTTNNEIYKIMIVDTIANLARGEKISKAYEDQWAFPVAAYEMIVTGERTGQLAEMMNRVAVYYKTLHKNMVSRVKALMEPFLIIFLTFVVGVILLAVIIPMFGMYQQVIKMG